jgi:anti-sigma-K factor RskA
MNNTDPNRLTREEILELLPAFVVGALDRDEMLAVDEYLQAHPELMTRLHELEAIVATLAYAAPPQPLPRSMLSKVINRAQASLPPKSQPLPASPTLSSARRVVPAQPASRQARQQGWFAGFGAWWRTRGAFALSLAGTALVALLFAVALTQALVQIDMLRRHITELNQQIATVQSQNGLLRDQNIQLQEELEANQNQLALLSGATEAVALGGTDAAPQASGMLFVNENQGTLVLHNLSGLEPTQTYQLWLIPPDGAPVPAGLLGQAGGPMETISLQLPSTLDGVAAVGVSVEPPSGSPAPTGPIVLLGETA